MPPVSYAPNHATLLMLKKSTGGGDRRRYQSQKSQNVMRPESCNWRGPQSRLLVAVVARNGVDV